MDIYRIVQCPDSIHVGCTVNVCVDSYLNKQPPLSSGHIINLLVCIIERILINLYLVIAVPDEKLLPISQENGKGELKKKIIKIMKQLWKMMPLSDLTI